MAKIDAEYLSGLEQNLNAQSVRLEGARLLLDVLLSRLAEDEPEEAEDVELEEAETAEVISGNS